MSQFHQTLLAGLEGVGDGEPYSEPSQQVEEAEVTGHGSRATALHQPTVTVTTITQTHWLPTVADPHHLPKVWFGGIYSYLLYSYYLFIFLSLCSQVAHAWYMPWSVKWNTTKLGVSTQYTAYQMLCSSHCHALATNLTLAKLICCCLLCM